MRAWVSRVGVRCPAGLWPSHTPRMHGSSVTSKLLPGVAITFLQVSQYSSLPEGVPTHAVPQLPSVGPPCSMPAKWFVTAPLLPASSARPPCSLVVPFVGGSTEAGWPCKLTSNWSLRIPSAYVLPWFLGLCSPPASWRVASCFLSDCRPPGYISKPLCYSVA